MSLYKYIVEQNYLDSIALTETILSDKRVKDVYNDMESVITTHYQSLYLHLKALSKYYTLTNDLVKARRLMSIANELTAAMNQHLEVKFKK